MFLFARYFIGFIFLVSLITGCELFTKYKKPEVDVLKNWNGTNIHPKHIHKLASLKWWHRFHSTELNTYISQALKENHQAKIAINNIELAQAELKTIKLSWIPGFPMVGGFTQLPIYGNPGTFIITAPYYMLNIIQLYQKQVSAEKKLQSAQYLKDATRLIIIHQVSSAYLSLLSQKEALKISQQLLNEYEKQLKIWRTQFNSGLLPIDKALETESKIYLLQSKIKVIQHNIYASQNVLHYLLNQDPGPLDLQHHFSQIPVSTTIPLDFPIHVLDNRPDIRKAQVEIESQYHHVDATIAKLLPIITLGGFYGYGRYIQGPINAPNASVILNTLDPPTYGKIDVSRARYRRKIIEYVHIIRKALKDVDTDLHAYQTYLTQYQKVNESYHTIQHHCHRSNIRKKYGITSSLDIINCQIQAHEIALIRNQKKLTQVLTITRLFADLGVGYGT